MEHFSLSKPVTEQLTQRKLLRSVFLCLFYDASIRIFSEDFSLRKFFWSENVDFSMG